MQASQPQVTDDEAELLYEQELDKIAKTELDTDCLDEWFLPLEEAPRTAHHSEVGKLFTAAETARRILIDRESGVQAVCVVEGISLQWAIELGHALKLDPMFFVEHVRALDEGARIRSLVQARNPNTTGGLRSTFGDAGRPWCTLRGVVDHGHIREDCKDKPIACATKRLVDKSNANEYLSHTNVSVYRVHEFLSLILVDQLPGCRSLFVLDEPQWYPNQTTVRIAMLDCPAYLTIPQLHWTRSKAVFTLWNHFFDDTQRMLLMAALNTHGVDELFYKAAFLECERHLVLLAQEIEDIGRNEICVGGMGTNQRLHDIRRVLHRLKVCVQENRAQEVRVARASSLRATGSDMRVREEFQSLVLMVKDLEMSLVQAFQLLMSTMSVKEMRDSLEQTRATHEQTRSMNVLTRLAVFYAPLSFAASIFGMNTREINDSAPSLETFGIVAVAILAFSVIVVAGGHGIQKALRKRKEERGEAMLLQRRTETPAREACDVLPSGEKGYKMTAWKSSRAQLSFARRKRATNNWRSGDDAC